MANAEAQTGYAPVNGLEMYYEVHGAGDPLVLLHGAYMTIGDTGPILTGLAEGRRVIAAEMQGHGRTADVDRPITYGQMADDVAALLGHLRVDKADVFGYSMGAGVGLQLAIRHPGLVRRLVAVSVSYTSDGMQPELHEMALSITPEMFAGSPFETMTMVVVGDADAVRIEHAVEMFRLLGGGAMGDLAGLSKHRLAVLPGTTHFVPPGSGVFDRADWLLAMVLPFLDGPEAAE